MLSNKQNIVISLGDDGAILTRFIAGKLVKRAFASSAYSSEFTNFVKDYPKDSVYLLLDTVDQNYIFSNLPSSVNSKNQLKIVKRKLQNEFDQNDLNSYINLGKDDLGSKKDVRYVFISLRNASPLTEWLEVIYDLPNKFMGIYLVPIEATDLVLRLEKSQQVPSSANSKIESKEKWQVLITHNRVGGFRQIVFKNGKIIFTRISQNTGLQSPDAVGINITQEASNTLEYIRRIGFTDQPLSVYIVAVKEAQQFIEIPGVNQKNVTFFSPLELAQKFALKEAALETDKFTDVILASNFINAKKKYLKISTAAAKKSENLEILGTVCTVILYILFLLFPVLTALELDEIIDNSSQLELLDRDKTGLVASVNSIKDFQKEFGIKPKLVNDAVKADTIINQSKLVLTDILNKINKIDVYSVNVADFDFEKNLATSQNKFTGKFIFDEPSIDNVNEILYKTTEFEKAVKQEFSDFIVTITGVPDEKQLSQMIIEKTKLSNSGQQRSVGPSQVYLLNSGIIVEVKLEK